MITTPAWHKPIMIAVNPDENDHFPYCVIVAPQVLGKFPTIESAKEYLGIILTQRKEERGQ